MWELKNLDTGEVTFVVDYAVNWAPRFVATHTDGRQRWIENGFLHRTGGPAVTYANGGQIWYQNGKTHRVGGPAVIYADGEQHWYKNGERTRV